MRLTGKCSWFSSDFIFQDLSTTAGVRTTAQWTLTESVFPEALAAVDIGYENSLWTRICCHGNRGEAPLYGLLYKN